MHEINENRGLLSELRVKFMTNFSATACAAPLCLVVSGLSENELIMTDEELKDSHGIFVLKVEGLSMHSNTDPLNTSHGYIIFMTSSKNEEYSADKGRYH